jgi:hypothetical protein
MADTITKPKDWTTQLCECELGQTLPFAEKHARSIRTLIGAAVKETQPDYVFSTKIAQGKLFVTRII